MASWMAYGALLSAIFGCAAWLLERVVIARRWPLRWTWQSALLASCVVPLLPAIWSTPAVPGHATFILQAQPAPAALSSQPPSNGNPPPAVPGPVNLPAIAWSRALVISPAVDAGLLYLWATLSVALLSWLIGSWLRLSSAIRRLPLAVIETVSVRISENLGPAVFGVIKPTIILPRWLLDAPLQLRAMVLAHERSHIAARDPLCHLASLLLVALQPWNLPLWWQVRRLRFALEVDCDRRVLRTVTDIAAYGEMLLSVSERRTAAPIGAMALTEPVSALEWRIRIMTDEGKRWSALLVSACGVCSISLVAMAAQVDPPPLPSRVDSAPQVAPPAPGMLIPFTVPPVTDSDDPKSAGSPKIIALQQLTADSPSVVELTRRLRDPADREVLRAWQRRQLSTDYAYLAESLSIGTADAERLLELLVEQRLEDAELQPLFGFSGFSPPVMAGNSLVDPQAKAKLTLRHMDQIRELVGADGLDRLLSFKDSLPERRKVAELERQLKPGEQLTGEQRRQLVALLKDNSRTASGRMPQLMGTFSSFDGGQGRNLLGLAQFHETVVAASRDLLAGAVGILTPQQFAVFERVQAIDVDQSRRNLEQLRARAGVSPEVAADTTTATATIAAGQALQLTFTAKVNENPAKTFRIRVEERKDASFEIADGIIAELTPSLGPDGRLVIGLNFYERTATGTRPIEPHGMIVADFEEETGPGSTREPRGGTVKSARATFDTALATVRGYYAIETTISARKL